MTSGTKTKTRATGAKDTGADCAAVEPETGLLRVTVDCGAPLRALITPSAAADIGVETGRDLVVTFKASAVRLY